MGDGETRRKRFFLGAIAPPQAAEGAQFCKLPPETRACRRAAARGVQGKKQRTCVWRKSQLNKTGRRHCCFVPRGRENSRVRIGASAIRPLEYFPFGRAAHALRRLKSACHGARLRAEIRRDDWRQYGNVLSKLNKSTTIKAFSQAGEGVERIARRMRGNAAYRFYLNSRVTGPLISQLTLPASPLGEALFASLLIWISRTAC